MVVAITPFRTSRSPPTYRTAANALRVFDALRERPLATVNALVGHTGISYPTASRMIDALERLGNVHGAKTTLIVFGTLVRITPSSAEHVRSHRRRATEWCRGGDSSAYR